MLRLRLLTLAACLQATLVAARFNILDFGAVSNDDSLKAEHANQHAIKKALEAANETDDSSQREVHVPTNMTFSCLPIIENNLTDITLTIDGTIKASKRMIHYGANTKNNMHIHNFFEFEFFNNLTIRGNGTVDGQGYMWWIREYLGTNPHGRPILLDMRKSNNIEVTGVRWINSPFFHMHIQDFENGYFHDFEIWVDAKGQLELDRLLLGEQSTNLAFPHLTLPTYPLNTDGIDPAGRNILIERVNITSYDDAVALKGSKNNWTYSKCTENVIVRDCNVWFSTGMTVGSIIPRETY